MMLSYRWQYFVVFLITFILTIFLKSVLSADMFWYGYVCLVYSVLVLVLIGSASYSFVSTLVRGLRRAGIMKIVGIVLILSMVAFVGVNDDAARITGKTVEDIYEFVIPEEPSLDEGNSSLSTQPNPSTKPTQPTLPIQPRNGTINETEGDESEFGEQGDGWYIMSDADVVNFTNPTPKSGDVLIMNDDLLVNVSFTGDNATVYLYNSSKALINSTSNTTASPYIINFSDLSRGVYYFNATSFDSNGDNSTETRNVLISPDGIVGYVKDNVKISDGLSGFNPDGLDSFDYFGSSVANIGDLDGDGVQDLAVGAYGDENSEGGEGALYILFMNISGGVESNVKISDGLNGFTPDGLDGGEEFGSSVANIGDLDGDGVQDLAVGAANDGRLGGFEGALYILFMNTSGGVKDNIKISDGLAGFYGDGLEDFDSFGSSVANLGDLDGDGVQDLAVGAHYDGNIDIGEGALYILFMNSNGSVESNVKISDGLNGFTPDGLGDGDGFGWSAVNIGDLDGDGVQDLAVGAYSDENGNEAEGALYILFMNTSGGVKDNIKISDGLAGFAPDKLRINDYFGSSVANIGDLDGDGVQDLAVGAYSDENSEGGEGALYILFMNISGGVKDHIKISDGLAGFYPDGLDSNDNFGWSAVNIGDLDGDGVVDLAVGAYRDENSEGSEGALYILTLGDPTIIDSDMSCSQLLVNVNSTTFGYDCDNTNYDSCIGLNSNLNITNTGSLTVEDCNIVMNNSVDEEYNITSYGGLIINYSNITAANLSNQFNFDIYNKTTIKNSYLYGMHTSGLHLLDDANYSLIENNTFRNGSRYGIYLYVISHSNITDNDIVISGSNGDGIHLGTYSNSNTIQDNTINTSGSNGAGIYLEMSSESNTITNNSIVTSGNNANGLSFFGSSDLNIIQDNTITTSGSSALGIYLDYSSNSSMISNTITTSGSSALGIYLLFSSNNLIQDTNISALNANDVKVELTLFGSNNTFLNVTYGYLNDSIGGGTSIIRQWYVDSYVDDTLGNGVVGASVEFRNNSDNVITTGTTDSSGNSRDAVTQYINAGGTRTYYSNYSVNGSKAGYNSHTQSLNVSGNKVINFTLENLAPILISNIPDLTWEQDSSITIDLSDYFYDEAGDSLSYSVKHAPATITVDIASGSNRTTFTPNTGFIGVEYVVFEANDSVRATESNNVTLTVTESEASPNVPGSGGISGGGGRDIRKESGAFVLSPSLIELRASRGELIREIINLIPIGNTIADISISHTLGGLLRIDIEELRLFPNKPVDVEVVIDASVEPDIYVGQIILENGRFSKDIAVIVHVVPDDKKVDLDLDLGIDPVYPGDIVSGDLYIENTGNFKPLLLDVNSYVKDINGDVLTRSREEKVLYDYLDYSVDLELPSNVKAGRYVFVVEVGIGDGVDKISRSFVVTGEPVLERPSFEFGKIWIVILLILALLFVVYESVRHRDLRVVRYLGLFIVGLLVVGGVVFLVISSTGVPSAERGLPPELLFMKQDLSEGLKVDTFDPIFLDLHDEFIEELVRNTVVLKPGVEVVKSLGRVNITIGEMVLELSKDGYDLSLIAPRVEIPSYCGLFCVVKNTYLSEILVVLVAIAIAIIILEIYTLRGILFRRRVSERERVKRAVMNARVMLTKLPVYEVGRRFFTSLLNIEYEADYIELMELMMDSGYSSSVIERSLVLLEMFSYIEYSLEEVPYSEVLEEFMVLLEEVGGF